MPWVGDVRPASNTSDFIDTTSNPPPSHFTARRVARVRAFPLLRLFEFPELSLSRCHCLRDGINGAGKLLLDQAPVD